jgi:excisionase family DNA binding protein
MPRDIYTLGQLRDETGRHSLPKVSTKPHALSIRQAVELSGIGRSTVYTEIAAGRLTARKLGRRTVILRDDFECWLEALPAMPRHRSR